MNLASAPVRHYVVALRHGCSHDTSATRDVTAASLAELLRVVRTGSSEFTCATCGADHTAVDSVQVVVEAEELAGRLGPYAGELVTA